MIKNYLKLAFRNLLRSKIFSMINILGLSIGLASSILVLLYLKNELTFDRMHEDKDNIYRVGFIVTTPTSKESTAVSLATTSKDLTNEFPEIESYMRVRAPERGFFTYKNMNYDATNICFADSTFFNFFSFKLLSGIPSSVLSDPHSVVLTNMLAKKIFGNEDPIGKILKVDNQYSVIVKGIAEDCPQNSSIQFSAIVSLSTMYDLVTNPKEFFGWNGNNNFYNFIKLYPAASIDKILTRLPEFMEQHINHRWRESGWLMELTFDRLDRMHLYAHLDSDPPAGDLKQVFIVALIGFFVILIAVFNFINLSTAQSSKRAVEIGVRKVLGAHKNRIAYQFIGEAMIYTLLAFVCALILVEIFQPLFIEYIGDYELYVSSNIGFIALLVMFTIAVGLMAGLYPSLYMARINPIKTLKGMGGGIGNRSYLRIVLVVLQFIISTVIISYTLVMLLQVNFMQKKHLGFDTENTMIIPLPSETTKKNFLNVKSDFESISEVEKVSASSHIIGKEVTGNGYLPEGRSYRSIFHFFAADYHFLDVINVEFVVGRNFSKEYANDHSAYIINEAFQKELGWDDPIGKKISRNGDHRVIGVVKDFHFDKVNSKIAPLIIGYSKEYKYINYMFIKLKISDFQQALHKIESKWMEVFPNEPFSYNTYDSVLKDNYADMKKSSFVLGIFAFLAVLITCMGLYGLAIFTVAGRKREIGVRKVFGAKTITISKLVVLDFVKWIVLANIISWPITYYNADKFLQTFPYAIHLNITPFLGGLVLSLFIAMLTIIFQIYKLSNTNPVESIKYE